MFLIELSNLHDSHVQWEYWDYSLIWYCAGQTCAMFKVLETQWACYCETERKVTRVFTHKMVPQLLLSYFGLLGVPCFIL